MAEQAPQPEPIQISGDTARWMLRRLVEHSFEGGLHGTCYECRFATPPLERDGRVADWRDISNDPTEAYFRCSLPGRPNDVVWGEYAPCTEEEYVAVLLRRGVPADRTLLPLEVAPTKNPVRD